MRPPAGELARPVKTRRLDPLLCANERTSRAKRRRGQATRHYLHPCALIRQGINRDTVNRCVRNRQVRVLPLLLHHVARRLHNHVGHRGDLLVKIAVQVPKSLTPEQEEAIKSLAAVAL